MEHKAVNDTKNKKNNRFVFKVVMDKNFKLTKRLKHNYYISKIFINSQTNKNQHKDNNSGE